MSEALRKRRAPRHRVPGIQGTLDSPGDVLVLDLSVHGIGFEAPRELHAGQSCFVELRHRGHVASMEVEIRWASAHRVERLRNTLVPVFRAGGAIKDLHRDSKGGVWDLVLPQASA
jgi:hypothetical protein